ncbi:hypothetical protein FJZ40_03760 [Candidatus Shapirobacteria bacterium]|nr:hypothetical protein [Candidatus Shapirobacteria bacterium]
MGYIQDLERDLREKLDGMDQEELIKFFKEKVLESYRNGMNAPQASKGKGRGFRPQAKSCGQA